jgi:hypothetical protein
VQNEIARVLEKENLRTEARIASSTSHGDDGTVVASTVSLREDVEEVRRRVERFQKRREELGVQGAESAREEVVKCYRCVFLYPPSLFVRGSRWAKFRTPIVGTTRSGRWIAGERLKNSGSRFLLLNRCVCFRWDKEFLTGDFVE